MLARFARGVLALCGWKVKGSCPKEEKCILIGAPHTSNWDFVLALMTFAALSIRCSWVAKHTLFHWPFGVLFRSIGGIPVDRGSGAAFFRRVLELFRERDNLVLVMSPEGTRRKTAYWKSGFYLLAVKAEVPIVLGYVDYASKTIGVAESFIPTGDADRDMSYIRNFYRGKQGRYPEKQGEITLKDNTVTSFSKK